MKKIINCIAIVSILMFTAAFSSCKPDETAPEKDTPVIEVEQTKIDVPQKGGDFSVSYRIKNADESLQLIAEWDEDREWISAPETESDGKVDFTVTANETEEIRTATLKLQYGESSAEVKICQLGKEAAKEFQINVKEVTYYSVLAEFVPPTETFTYIISSIPREMYENDMQSDDDLLFEKTIELFEKEAGNYNMNLTDFLIQANLLKAGVSEMNFDRFNQKTDYYIFIVPIDEYGNKHADLFKKMVTTKAVDMLDVTFDIEYEIDQADIRMTVIPSDDNAPYFFNAIRKSDVDKSGKDIETLAQDFLNDLIYMTNIMYGYTREETIAEIVSYGKDQDEFTIEANTEYIGYVSCLNERGLINSEIYTENFTGGEVLPSDNILTLSVENINVDKADLICQPSNDDPYVLVADPKKNWEGMSDEEIIKGFVENIDMSYFQKSGYFKGTAKNLLRETDYYVFAFGFYGNTVTTPLFKTEFRTIPAESSVDMEFQFAVTDIEATSARALIAGTPSSALYYWGIAGAEQTEEQLKKEIDAYVKDLMNQGYIGTKYEYMQMAGARGYVDKYIQGLGFGTEYKLYAVGIDEATGNWATEFSFSEVFKTMDATRSDADVEVTFDKYFDGEEMNDIYTGQYKKAIGKAVVPLKAVPNETAVKYYYHIYTDDLTDTEKYPDGLLINNLIDSRPNSVPEKTIYCTYDIDLTIASVAVDENGNYGEVHRQKIRLTKDGTSPAEEFESMAEAPALLSSERLIISGTHEMTVESREAAEDSQLIPGEKIRPSEKCRQNLPAERDLIRRLSRNNAKSNKEKTNLIITF